MFSGTNRPASSEGTERFCAPCMSSSFHHHKLLYSLPTKQSPSSARPCLFHLSPHRPISAALAYLRPLPFNSLPPSRRHTSAAEFTPPRCLHHASTLYIGPSPSRPSTPCERPAPASRDHLDISRCSFAVHCLSLPIASTHFFRVVRDSGSRCFRPFLRFNRATSLSIVYIPF